jgi:ribose 5-phosphate isomerase A
MTSAAELSPIDRIALRALDFVRDDMIVGLGSGRAATAFIQSLGARVRDGLRVRGIPTSEPTAAVAREVGIPLVGFEEAVVVDVTVDGADEVDPNLDLIKGYGRALVREKIVAAASRQEIILVGEEKMVPRLGSRGLVPVEVLPFAAPFCAREFAKLGCRPQRREEASGAPVISDNGNWILDCGVDPIADARALDAGLRAVPGVVGTGLFVGIADVVLVGMDDGRIRELTRHAGG